MVENEEGAAGLQRLEHRFVERDRIGSIAPGKNADLFIVKGNPAAKIEDIENVIVVFKDGVGYESRKLIDSVKGRYGQY